MKRLHNSFPLRLAKSIGRTTFILILCFVAFATKSPFLGVMLHIGYRTTILLLEPLFLLHTHSYKLVQVPHLS
jgi:hypothetical protein